ncbi:MAG: peptidylprolyl isomerase [Halothiobacillus sp. 24-54-40]|jgi:FKBP-type peptidyl-prolyl cis-trans isomerase SlyD|nr:peptidylprolyl isomerase [Halothiobacillaceae bacterium]OYV47325.1 MAG: peptidylprolyl isomerase [Halothiobacillus sp. 20-53-49]OYY42519.1 MAG: peptidylprolyl isomerase [Halothiobacillus sp. 35-54-62]OYZ87923.1 MAG: peptidylprolyl isomerase [Halothiobacillus sp. 24-54-40]OZA81458.1 MAG: peptidylprolyl isomerase [Halothiobacillus sp. 39-53-45]HQS02126.1 peptidylprolyl isomerase [Halothiobacillus sp.]
MQVSENTVVAIEYTLKNDAGDVLDSSVGHAPLTYLHGHHNIISGLENALLGKKIGDTFTVTIPPEEAYGLRDDSMTQVVPRHLFQGVDEIVPGMKFHAEAEHGVNVVTVIEVKGDQVHLDANHELAGETLHFDVVVQAIRAATDEEIEHGHAHGPEGHHHH